MPIDAIQRKKYIKKLDDIIGEAVLFTDATVEQVLKVLKEFERRVRFTLYGYGEDKMWALRHWRSIQSSIDELISRFQYQLQTAVYGGFERIAEFGDDIIERPLFELGFNIPIISVDPKFLIIADQYSLDLIMDIGEDLRKAITRHIRFGLSGEQTAFQVMGEITKDLGTKTIGMETVKGVAYQAERIVRTEMHRVQGMASQARLEKASKIVPDLKKQWICSFINSRQSHKNAHGQVVDYDKPFRVGGDKLMYPGDPRGSAKETINCGCTQAPYVK